MHKRQSTNASRQLPTARLRYVLQLLRALGLDACGTVYGTWLASPIPGVCYHWLTPSLWDILFSVDRSLFYWTPLVFLAFLGMLIGLARGLRQSAVGDRHGRIEPLVLLLGAFLVQVYVLSAMWGQGESLPETGNFAGVFLARSFGFRDLTESLVALAPGLALLLDLASRRCFAVLRVSGAALIVWNLLLVGAYANGQLPQTTGADLPTLFRTVRDLVSADPTTLILAGMGPVLLELMLLFDAQAKLPDGREPDCALAVGAVVGPSAP